MYRRLLRWLGLDDLDDENRPLELPWSQSWAYHRKYSAGPGFSRKDYREARTKARVVAQTTLGMDVWLQLERLGYVDLPSGKYPGLTYRLRVGRRIEVLCEPGVRSPWAYSYLCINPTYPLPEEEFFAHLYLYVRDHEEEVIRVAAPQPWDQRLGRTF
jgi:hypothetical protein